MSNGFTAGSLVKARGREWVVLPSPEDDLVMVRPLGGADHEETGIVLSLEPVKPARFAPPDPGTDIGDHRSAKLLRDALRLGFRSSAGPLRCAARIAVDPRPYQLVPLLMALRLDPVRLLIADDVGVGKTIEAALVASELIEQGGARRLAVLCPPHLAEQWQAELASKFHIDATLVLASTAARLERDLPHDRSLFDVHDRVIVSLDYIKSDRRRDDFIRTCPELVIVDEAHTCAASGETGPRHQRHALVKALAADPERHMVLVTATPHSGKEGAFRSLLGLIGPDFENLPDDLGGEANRAHRERLARHLVQRRRADIARYLQTDTSFPARDDAEATYRLTPEYAALFDDVLRYARAEVRDPGAARHRQRVRWWSALGLLRALASSPAAAAATMRTRAVTACADTAEEADEIGRARVLDLDDPEEGADVVPGADTETDTEAAAGAVSRRLRDFARRADGLRGSADAKLAGLVGLVKEMLEDGFCPIVFCRFIPTAVYVGEELTRRLPKKLGARVEAVTGLLPPGEREARVADLAAEPRRVLVATDCLSEGINLQDPFSAVIHYDLPWNPTRLEQREGRVDRFGQRADQVKAVTYYCADNHIDETVLEVLLHKHRAIRKALGISIPVPGSTSDVIDALAENVLLSAEESITQRLPGLEEQLRPAAERLNREWDAARDRESSRRSLFMQVTINPDEVAGELEAVRAAIGSGADVAAFTRAALTAHGAGIAPWPPRPDNLVIDLSETPPEVRDALGTFGANGDGGSDKVKVRFERPGETGVTVLERTHPAVAGLAGFVLDTALDPQSEGVAKRCGAIRTAAVARLTTLLVCRFRFNMVSTVGGVEHPMLAEEAGLLAFVGAPSRPDWIDDPGRVESLLDARPSGSLTPEAARRQVRTVLDARPHWAARINAAAAERAEATADAHQRVRETGRSRFGSAGRLRVTPQLPPDIVGLYVFVPDVRAGQP